MFLIVELRINIESELVKDTAPPLPGKVDPAPFPLINTKLSKVTFDVLLMLKIRLLLLPLINRVSVVVYNPIMVNALLKPISLSKVMVSLPPIIKLGLKRMVSPVTASMDACLNEPRPESFILSTIIVLAWLIIVISKAEVISNILFISYL